MENEIVLFETEDHEVKLHVPVENNTVWLNRKQLAELFGRDVKTIGKHINNALKEELDNSVVANFATTAVNLSMVYAYYEIGRMIVEEEQHGENRATYGKKLLKELSTYLTGMFGKGYSAENLKLMRRFYSIYSHDQIGETVFTQFENLPAISTGRKFYLSWSHYLKLMRIDNIDERHFYEIECVKNDWSLSELKRQYNSALYERLALSTDKDKVYRLALEGQKVETPKDAVKDPYVLEFLRFDYEKQRAAFGQRSEAFPR